MAIAPITTGALSLPGTATPAATSTGGGDDFGNALSKLIESVEANTGEANQAVAAMNEGTGDVHTAMLALQRAEVSMQLTVQVRNKLVQAYQDLMRMPI